jgi:hypothetical protein
MGIKEEIQTDPRFIQCVQDLVDANKTTTKIFTEEQLMNLSMEEIQKIHSDRVQHYIKDRSFGSKLSTVAKVFGKDDNSSYSHYTYSEGSITYYYDFYGSFGRISVFNNIVFQTSGPQIIKPGEWCDRLEELYTKAHSLKEIQDAERLNREKEKFIRNKLV